MMKSWKVSFLLFELKGFILALAINILKDFILVLLLEVTGGEKRTAGPDSHMIDTQLLQKELGLEQFVFEKSYIAL